jgi:integrase
VDEKTLFVSGRDRREGSSFTPESVRAIRRKLAGTKSELFFITLALTGLRAGEILGLRVSDCDMTRRLMFVRQTSWEGLIIDGAKTEASKNSVPMPSLVWEMLVKNPPKGELFFPNRKGGPHRRGKIVEKVLYPVMDELGFRARASDLGFTHFVMR